MGTQPGFGNQPQSKSVRVTVIGHASTRWRGAKSRAEADRLNMALSKQRAENVRLFVEQVLKREIVNVTILPGASSVDGYHPNGVQVGSYGVGSYEPVLRPSPPVINPQENNPVNRSVVVLIELITTHYQQGGASRAPIRIGARSRFWYGKVMTLQGGAVGAGAFFMRLALRNPRSDKTASYSGYLGGGGVGAKISRDNPKDGVGDEFSFSTNDEMGFNDFDGVLVRVEKAGAALGLKAKVAYITFIGLGSGASTVKFQGGFSVGLKPDLEGYVVSGKLNLEGSSPGDWYEIDGGTDVIPYAIDHKTGNDLIVSFPTGKAAVSELLPEERRKLDSFVSTWARRY